MNSIFSIRVNPWREIAIFMIILMEVCWITPWFRSLTPETYAVSGIRVLTILAIMISFSYLLIKSMDYLQLKKSIRQGLMVVFLIICCYAGIRTMIYAHEAVSIGTLLSRPIDGFADVTTLIPVEFIIIITVLICFWRGITLAQENIGPSTIRGHFWMGIVMFLAFTLLITIVTGETPGDFFFLFLFSSLTGISSARMTVVGMVRGGNEVRFNRSWFTGLVMAALFVVGISFLVGSLLADRFGWIGSLFLGVFSSILVLVWLAVNPLISFIVKTLANIFRDSQAISALSDNVQKFNDMMRGFGQRVMGMLENSGLGSLFSRWGATLKTIVLTSIIIILVAGIILWMAIRLWRDREHRLFGEETKSDLPDGNLIKSLRALLLQNWNKVKASVGQIIDLRHFQKVRAAARIRQIYAELMELSKSLGQPRLDAQTPLEFVPKLEGLFPELQPELLQITNAYLNVRYGLLPETKAEVNLVENAWQKINHTGKELIREYKKIDRA